MRICFLGAGALGSSLGGVLSEAGLDVSLVDPWREHVESLILLWLQNGLGNEETLEDVVGKARLIGGRTFAGGVLLGPGHVMVGRTSKKTYIGELDGSLTDRVQEISRIFTQAGLETLVSPNVVEMMWDKLLFNSATGALAGITRLPYGKL